MRRLRVCIYGGTALQGMPVEFITALARKVLEKMDAVIVTGGFRDSEETRKSKTPVTSTDSAALMGADQYSKESGRLLKDCFEAWLPDPALDRADGTERMTENDGISIVPLNGRTALGRRLAMVAAVDMLVTISGRRHTEIVLEQALELGRPVVPIPDAGGDSRDLLEHYRKRIAANFDDGALDKCLQRVKATIHGQPDEAAEAVVRLLQTARVGRCLVLSPFDDEHDALYASVVEPAVARHMVPVRLDRHPRSDAIYDSFAEAIRSAAAVIIDITALNRNVMYEVGYAHGHGAGLPLLLYTRKEVQPSDLPIYFRTLNVRWAASPGAIPPLIAEFLESVKRGPRAPEVSES
jgi:hypothetical protein